MNTGQILSVGAKSFNGDNKVNPNARDTNTEGKHDVNNKETKRSRDIETSDERTLHFGAPIMAPVQRPYFIFNEDVTSAGVRSYYVV